MSEHITVYRDRVLVSKLLKRYRAQLGLSQEGMAALCGVRANTYARWERNEIKPPVIVLSSMFPLDETENCEEVSRAAVR